MGWTRRNMLFTSGAALAVAACGSSPKPAASTPKPAPASPTPAASTGFPLTTDTATRLDLAKVRALSAAGVRTVFRYYCHLPASLPGKDLQPEEAKIILGEGLSIGSVFQHYNNCFRTFENNWGKEDAEQALRMARAASQPAGSAIYFGVDADWPYQQLRDPIVKYFEDVKRAFEGSGLNIGIYSNGCVCNAIREKGLADYFWLSGSTGHSGTQAFYNTGRWTLFQSALDITPPSLGYGVDCSIANPSTAGAFGQWNERGPATHSDADTRAVFTARRFLTAATDLKQSADTTSSTLIALKKDQNVRLLETSGSWTRVQTQEGGVRAGAAALTGWLPTTSLIPMDRFGGNTSDYGLCGAPTVVSDATKYQNCERATSRNR